MWPALQRTMQALSENWFSRDTAPDYLLPPKADRFVAVSCGVGALTSFLTASGRVYMLGQNFYGQCGVGDVKALSIAFTPVPVTGFEPEERFLGVACGIDHALCVSRDGAVYAWGRGDRGQVGIGDAGSYLSAVRVLGRQEHFLDERMVSVAAGPAASGCISQEGTCYVWGKMLGVHPRKARGDGEIIEDARLPRALHFEPAPESDVVPRATHLTFGQAHASIRTDDGRLWMIGLRGRGRLFDDSDVLAAAAGSAAGGSSSSSMPSTPTTQRSLT
ncbi:hypothetical protein EON67_00925, partial [archaeon]